MASHLEDSVEILEGTFPSDQKTQQYGNLFFLLQSEPRHIAALCRLVTMAEIDTLLQTVMFTIYGNQYESREEHLLLTMFQVNFAGEALPASIYANIFSFSPYSLHSLIPHLNTHPYFGQIRLFLE